MIPLSSKYFSNSWEIGAGSIPGGSDSHGQREQEGDLVWAKLMGLQVWNVVNKPRQSGLGPLLSKARSLHSPCDKQGAVSVN